VPLLVRREWTGAAVMVGDVTISTGGQDDTAHNECTCTYMLSFNIHLKSSLESVHMQMVVLYQVFLEALLIHVHFKWTTSLYTCNCNQYTCGCVNTAVIILMYWSLWTLIKMIKSAQPTSPLASTLLDCLLGTPQPLHWPDTLWWFNHSS